MIVQVVFVAKCQTSFMNQVKVMLIGSIHLHVNLVRRVHTLHVNFVEKLLSSLFISLIACLLTTPPSPGEPILGSEGIGLLILSWESHFYIRQTLGSKKRE